MNQKPRYVLFAIHAIFISSFLFLLQSYLTQDVSPAQNTQTISPVATPAATPTINQATTSAEITKVIVTRIIDGDTFEISDGSKVRLIGINSPEIKGEGGKSDCFALEAKNKLASLLNGKEVYLRRDVSEVDKYNRLLRYAYVDNLLVNEYMLSEGYAQVATYPPDTALSGIFVQSERQARKEKLGLWKACQ